jgi:exodeoxyribonuclease-5
MDDIVLSPDQETACTKLIEALIRGERVLVLTGSAGTGKTTLVRVLIERIRELGWNAQYAASTGKAAVRLSQTVGLPATTVHAALYGSVRETLEGQPVFLDPKPPCTGKTVLVVDEASMIDEALDLEIRSQMPRDSVLLYVGDRNQLPPVVGNFGPNFAEPTAILTEIHRRALDNPITQISCTILAGGKLPMDPIGDTYCRSQASLAAVASFVTEQQEAGKDLVVLCWTNDVRQRMNRLIRRNLGYDKEGPVTVNDRLLVLYNNRKLGRMNGEVARVKEVLPFEDSPWMKRTIQSGVPATEQEMAGLCVRLEPDTQAFIHPGLIGAPLQEFRDFTRKGGLRLTDVHSWLHVDYGQAITVHRSQGSEWATVVFLIDRSTRLMAKKNPDQARQLVYTGITRAKERLHVFDV